MNSLSSSGLGHGILATNGSSETCLPKGVYAHDLESASNGMRRRNLRGLEREQPGQLSIFPGEVRMHYGPGT